MSASIPDLTTGELLAHARQLAAAPAPGPHPIRAAVDAYVATSPFYAQWMTQTKRFFALRGTGPAPTLPPTLAELKGMSLTAGQLVAAAPEGCGLGVKELVEAGIVSRGEDGLQQLLVDLGLQLEDLLPADVLQRERLSLPVLVQYFGDAHAVLTALKEAPSMKLKAGTLASKQWLPRLHVDDWRVLDAWFCGPKMREYFGRAAVIAWLRTAVPAKWALGGVTAERLLSPEWALGPDLTDVARNVGWDEAATLRAFPARGAPPAARKVPTGAASKLALLSSSSTVRK